MIFKGNSLKIEKRDAWGSRKEGVRIQKEADDSQQRERVARISARVAELTEDAEQLQIQLQLLSWKLIQVQRALEELYVQMA